MGCRGGQLASLAARRRVAVARASAYLPLLSLLPAAAETATSATIWPLPEILTVNTACGWVLWVNCLGAASHLLVPLTCAHLQASTSVPFRSCPAYRPNETISLHGAQLSVRVESGDKAAGEAYVRKAWRLAERDWSVNGAGKVQDRQAASSSTSEDESDGFALPRHALVLLLCEDSWAAPTRQLAAAVFCLIPPTTPPPHTPPACPAAAATPMNGARGPSVQVMVRDASCATPACYTAATNESYSLSISAADGVQIAAETLIGASHAFASLASLANPEAEITCLPIQSEPWRPSVAAAGGRAFVVSALSRAQCTEGCAFACRAERCTVVVLHAARSPGRRPFLPNCPACPSTAQSSTGRGSATARCCWTPPATGSPSTTLRRRYWIPCTSPR